MMFVRGKIVAALILLGLVASFFYVLTNLGEGKGAEAGPLGDLAGFLRSSDVKSEVTIVVVGLSSFVIGLGLRDVLGRMRLRSTRAKPEEGKAK